MVTAKEDAHSTYADKNASDLSWVVAHTEESERDHNNNNNSPKVDELGRKDGGITIGKDGEVVALDIKEGQNEI